MFQRARRGKVALRLALCGQSGSGKTYSALLVAAGLGGRVAVIDTEQGSSELYSGLCEFDVLRLDPPYSPQRYVWALSEAARAGYELCVVDSLTQAWSGEGGVLSMVDAARDAKGTGRGAATRDPWGEPIRAHYQLMHALAAYPGHVIVTLRVRTQWQLVSQPFSQAQGAAPRAVRVGLGPEQRPGIECEFTTVLELSQNHVATAIKDRTGLFGSRAERLSQATGSRLRRWLDADWLAGAATTGFTFQSALDSIAACGTMPSLTRLWARSSAAWKQTPWFRELSNAVWERMRLLDEQPAPDLGDWVEG